MTIRETATYNNDRSNNNSYNPSTPLFADFLDEPEIVLGGPASTLASAPIATPLSNTSFRRNDNLVVIPPGDVILEESPSNYYHHTTTPATIAPTATAVGTPQITTIRYINGRPVLVSAKNAHLPDTVISFKEKRKHRTIVASWTGGVIGLVALGPLGAVIGATGAYAAAKSFGKQRERKLLRQCTAQEPQVRQEPAHIYTAEVA